MVFVPHVGPTRVILHAATAHCVRVRPDQSGRWLFYHAQLCSKCTPCSFTVCYIVKTNPFWVMPCLQLLWTPELVTLWKVISD